jgi:hypothetical protein
MTSVLSSTRVLEPRARRRRASSAAAAAAVLSVVGAGIHLWVVPEHREEWWAFAAFFVAVAAGQLLSAALLLWRPQPTLLLTVVAANTAVVLVWVFSRTTGLPVGPPVTDMTGGRGNPSLGGYGAHASHEIEAVGPLDLAATVLELLVVVALVSLLPPLLRRRAVNMLLVTGLVLWGLYAAGVVS